mmetsp:Transcript_23762/g.62111  ORF Transcript_23762/g.62111 Transcript_23762/m.62111 type:complete len:359 (+) Transcript_23762:146-1222(+)
MGVLGQGCALFDRPAPPSVTAAMMGRSVGTAAAGPLRWAVVGWVAVACVGATSSTAGTSANPTSPSSGAGDVTGQTSQTSTPTDCRLYTSCTECLAGGCAFTYFEVSAVCAEACMSRSCYDARPLDENAQYRPHAAECPSAFTTASSTAGATTVAATTWPVEDSAEESTSMPPDQTNVKRVHGHDEGGGPTDSYSMVGGVVVGVLALSVSILLFAYLRIRDGGSLLPFHRAARTGAGEDDEDDLTQRLLFDGRDSTDVPLIEPSDYNCELDLSQPALDREYPQIVDGTNRLWAPFAVPTSPTSPTSPHSALDCSEPTSAWHEAASTSSVGTPRSRPPSVIRPPSVTAIHLAPVDDVPF